MRLLVQYLVSMLFIVPFTSSGQTDNTSREKQRGHLFIKPGVNLGFKTEEAMSSESHFKILPTIYVGYTIRKSTFQLGVNHFVISDYNSSIRCFVGPCPNASESRITAFLIDYHLQFLDRQKWKAGVIWGSRISCTHDQVQFVKGFEDDYYRLRDTQKVSRIELYSGVTVQRKLGKNLSFFASHTFSLNLLLAPVFNELLEPNLFAIRTGLRYDFGRK